MVARGKAEVKERGRPGLTSGEAKRKRGMGKWFWNFIQRATGGDSKGTWEATAVEGVAAKVGMQGFPQRC